MDMNEIKEDPIQEQMKVLDEVIADVESMLADADEAITKAIEKRGKLATKVQHLWIRRHYLNNALEKIRSGNFKDMWPR